MKLDEAKRIIRECVEIAWPQGRDNRAQKLLARSEAVEVAA